MVFRQTIFACVEDPLNSRAFQELKSTVMIVPYSLFRATAILAQPAAQLLTSRLVKYSKEKRIIAGIIPWSGGGLPRSVND